MNEMIKNVNYPKHTASQKAKEIISFLTSENNDTYVVAEYGQRLLGIGIVIGDYYYDETKELSKCRNVQWNWIIDNGSSLPDNSEGVRTTYYRLKKDENLCFLYNVVLHGETSVVTKGDHPKGCGKEQFLSEVFIKESEFDKLSSLLKNKKNIILQGAPGVGKTFAAKRLAYALMGVKDDDRIRMVQFHQSYSYEDFIEGYRPNETGGFDLRDGVFKEFCDAASKDANRDYFFIIDEINRGNLSKIFGELLMLIEADKRGNDYSVNLVYSNKKLSLPENLYIIGMMNTADRSLAMIDYALRRRFAFYTMTPAFDNKTFDNKYSVVE
ncbi:MAG: AAA family ATPase, partial [Ruminococcus sp.]|nr:AAA family ATPase [Ruminococcus sp.]